jgi:hypothetical protein
VHKHKNNPQRGEHKKWDGEEEHGPEEAHTATYHHGKDPDGHTAAEATAEDGGTPTHKHAEDTHGSHDGGGQTQHTRTSRPRRNLKKNYQP